MILESRNRRKSVLVCCCDEGVPERVAKVLGDAWVRRLDDECELLKLLETEPIDVVLTGRGRTGREAVEILQKIRAAQPGVRAILKPRETTRGDVIAAMRLGAFSYFIKPYFETAFDEMLRHATTDDPWQDSLRVEAATPAWLRIVARCEMATADRIIQFLNELSDLTGKDRESMGFALKEIMMNAMEYGGQFNRERLVEVSYVRASRMVLYRVRDPGSGFSLEELTHAAISNPPDEPVKHLEVRDSMGIRPGGYGVLLSRKLVDDLIYSEQGNDVLLIKYVDLMGKVRSG